MAEAINRPKKDNVAARRANMLDAKFLWVLRNLPSVYKFCCHNKPVEWQEHIDWLIPVVDGKTKRTVFVIEVDGEKAGQVRFDDQGAGNFIVNLSFLEKFRGRGVSSQGYLLALAELKKEKPVKTIIAEIHKDNIVSIKFFAKLGFQLKSQKEIWLKYIWQRL